MQVVLNSVRLLWAPATDPDGLACYQVYEASAGPNGTDLRVGTFGPDVTEGTVYVNWPSGTTPSRIATLYVVAIDSWGAETASPSVQVTIYNDRQPFPTPTPTSSDCRVAYNSTGWPGGMTVALSITNTGTTPISGWRLSYTYPDPGQRVASGWSATWSQTGSAVTATSLSWNQNLAPGATTTIGYTGTNRDANPAPTSFQLNGVTCG